ncbi:hypothetical protein LOKO_02738 [Halomonas chromatireducens]|uniref:Uncharacterized protein n=1 Tax=Halomonas chromatireducens TaxID=507626 RepID=A0A0X8HFU3_9GAMM|nr:hypothetical protein LOKO_02738 [Halomonas chromatireducens]
MAPVSREKQNVAILVTSQVLFMVASITVMTLSGVVGQQLSPDPGLATLPIAMMMLGTVVSTLPASLYMKRVVRVAMGRSVSPESQGGRGPSRSTTSLWFKRSGSCSSPLVSALPANRRTS